MKVYGVCYVAQATQAEWAFLTWKTIEIIWLAILSLIG